MKVFTGSNFNTAEPGMMKLQIKAVETSLRGGGVKPQRDEHRLFPAHGTSLCAAGLGAAPAAKMEAMVIQSKSGQAPAGSRAVPPKSPAG